MTSSTDGLFFDADAAVIPIGAVSASLGVHAMTLRSYDKIGVVSPARSSKNRRNYSFNDVEKIRLTLFLMRNLSFNLAGVKFVMAILEENNVPPRDYLSYVNNIAKIANIDTDKPKEKSAKRGASKKGKKAVSKKAKEDKPAKTSRKKKTAKA